MAADAAEVADLAAAYQRGEPCPGSARTWVQEDVRKVDSGLRSRLLNLRYLEPARYRELRADGVLPLSEPDRLLLEGKSDDATAAYRTRIADSADPQPTPGPAWRSRCTSSRRHRSRPRSPPGWWSCSKSTPA